MDLLRRSNMTELSSRKVVICDPDQSWPERFSEISANLKKYLSAGSASYKTIEHIGSTAVPGLPAKDNIDIIIIVANAHDAESVVDALLHEAPADSHYVPIGDGGIRGRISLKHCPRDLEKDQSVYILCEDNPDSMLMARGHRALRDTLRAPEHKWLKDEYGKTKIELAKTSTSGLEYGRRKNPIIRKILKAAGWTDEDIIAEQALDHRVSWDDDLPY